MTGASFTATAAVSTRSMLFGLQPGDVEPIALACACLAAAALVAVVLPAHRAATVEPMTALRHE